MTYNLTIGWLYPDLMSTYGDRGNITVLKKRCEWRDIRVNIVPIDQTINDTSTSLSASQRLKTIGLLFGGGAQDREQEIVMRDLKKKKSAIKQRVEEGMPALFVCGAPQLMGKYYEPAEGKRIEGLGIFNMVSKHPGPSIHRLIGNIAAKVEWQNLNLPPVIASETEERHSGDPPAGGDSRISQDGRDPGQARLAAKRARMTKREIAAGSPSPRNDKLIVGFENHGGRTYLGENAKPFAKVVKGYGNNGEDGTEGVVYKNAMGCYFHGPLLPKNPHIADWLIQKSLEVKYKEAIKLETLDDSLEWRAHQAILEKLSITRRL